jgi:hypothetical protein
LCVTGYQVRVAEAVNLIGSQVQHK